MCNTVSAIAHNHPSLVPPFHVIGIERRTMLHYLFEWTINHATDHHYTIRSHQWYHVEHRTWTACNWDAEWMQICSNSVSYKQ